MSEERKRIIRQLLHNRKDVWPGSGKEMNFEAKGGYEPSGGGLSRALLRRWAYDPELLRRAGVKLSPGDVAEAKSHVALDKALDKIAAWMPYVLEDLAIIYHEEAGENELPRLRKISRGSGVTALRALKTVSMHDFAIDVLARLLEGTDLYAREPERMTPSRQDAMEEKHDGIYRVYRSFREEGLPKTRAVKETVLLYRTVKLEDLAESTVWRVLSIREGEGDNMAPKRRRKSA